LFTIKTENYFNSVYKFTKLIRLTCGKVVSYRLEHIYASIVIIVETQSDGGSLVVYVHGI
jgi:hypothetical protein